MNAVVEIFGNPIGHSDKNWNDIVQEQSCPYIGARCFKVRKSEPNVSMGTCAVDYSKASDLLVICPARLLERKQIFVDCLHLLANHQPGNELHLVPEFSLPGGSVDYFIVSVRRGKAVDFVGVELQTLDTTGDWWPLRQRELSVLGVPVQLDPQDLQKQRGINWKMTAKTILVQMHHKIKTFESVNRKLVLVIQDRLLDYMKREFAFDHVSDPHVSGDSMQFHAYQADRSEVGFELNLSRQLSTDAAGVAACLGLQAEANIALTDLLKSLEDRITAETRFVPVQPHRS